MITLKVTTLIQVRKEATQTKHVVVLHNAVNHTAAALITKNGEPDYFMESSRLFKDKPLLRTIKGDVEELMTRYGWAKRSEQEKQFQSESDAELSAAIRAVTDGNIRLFEDRFPGLRREVATTNNELQGVW